MSIRKSLEIFSQPNSPAGTKKGPQGGVQESRGPRRFIPMGSKVRAPAPILHHGQVRKNSHARGAIKGAAVHSGGLDMQGVEHFHPCIQKYGGSRSTFFKIGVDIAIVDDFF